MRRAITALTLALCALPAFAAKPCEELKSEIAAKLDAKGVKGYELAIRRSDAVAAEKIIGSCEGGSKKITYRRGS